MAAYLQQARRDGHDYVLVVERLQDGPVEAQGTNGRWPVTFVTWILLGIGMFNPDQTFESRATLRVTLRDLAAGRTLHDPLLFAGPIDLSLVERTDVWGVLESIVVPPFLVGDDEENVRAAVRATTERRLLSSLVRELKSGAMRQRLRERAAAGIALAVDDGGRRIVARAANEDDDLLASAAAPDFLFAGIADGMGGLAGGAEASRTALRAIAAVALEAVGGGDVAAAVPDGFAAAARRVAETSATVPALRDMGTTATVLCLADGVAHVGHVGDTRLYRLRAGALDRLTVDRAVREPD
ncbi:MAG: hypothetical protein FJ306_04170, partial [Planctomycetes bacterium]|nr:hypothetical protein [Planctomycetota bacterium]